MHLNSGLESEIAHHEATFIWRLLPEAARGSSRSPRGWPLARPRNTRSLCVLPNLEGRPSRVVPELVEIRDPGPLRHCRDVQRLQGAVDEVIETMRRGARGLCKFDNYRLRALVVAGGYRPWRKTSATFIDERHLRLNHSSSAGAWGSDFKYTL